MYHVAYDDNNKIVGYYHEAIHKDIPEQSFPITNEQWQEAINTGANTVGVKTKTLVCLEDEGEKEKSELVWRDRELRGTDFISMSDYPNSDYKKAMVRYRQRLRDYPEKKGFPDCKRPVKPIK